MHFTRLRLTGFKSFVDPTDLVIGPGLTGVVGPNGCGKSNLLEAIRWVMGESRASAMRGGGMDDVIFAGSARRPARSHAEVTLTLDNRDRRAPAGFNEADMLEVTRRITRDAGSAYRANGREARARDIAMLFADASTGAQSPALVRQGQISELINARPKARRRILEEAAGISGLYHRRHEAELKLRETEANLERLGDVVEALSGQLEALSKQARQAARYRTISEGLRRAEALLLARLWRDAEAARTAADADVLAATRKAASAESAAAAALLARDAAEAAVPAAREEDTVAAAVLQRSLLERDRLDTSLAEARSRIAALEAAVGQLATDAEREASLDGDAAAMDARLVAEQAVLLADGARHQTDLAEAQTAAARAEAALKMAEAAFDLRAETAARLAAAIDAARARRTEAARRAADLAKAQDQARAGLDAAEADLARALAANEGAQAAASRARARADAAEAALTAADRAAQGARALDTAARADSAEALGAARALSSEVAAVERLLARPASAAPPILDRIRAEPGFEAALGAALAEDASHPVAGPDGAGGWSRLDALDTAPWPEGVAPLAPHVSVPPELLRRIAAVGLVAGTEGARLQRGLSPGQRLVSRDGDLWRWDGLHVPAGTTPGAAAERLRQVNRLADLKARASEAEARGAAARTAQAQAEARLAEATRAETAARAERRAADQALSEADRAASRAEAAAEAARQRAAGLRAGLARRTDERAAADAALVEATRAEAALPDAGAAREDLASERLNVEAARLTMLTRRAEADELGRAEAARARRLADIDRDLDSWRKRRAAAAERLAGLERRTAATRAELQAARATPPDIEARRAALAEVLADAETRRRRASDALALAETALRTEAATLRAAERAASEAREARARTEARAEAAAAAADQAADRLRAEMQEEPADLLARLCPDPADLPEAADLDAEATRLRRARDALGAVNLRAEEDAAAVAAERDALASDKADLEEAVAKLRLGIANLNREGRGRLMEAFEAVNRNFGALFRHLFGGGEANLVLVESDDPLEAGLEIFCQPPGKKLATLSLLSGGEQTLTALSLIFAVFLANPSPICVLDEVDAPLDDANVTRFCDLLDEMTARTETRFLIITHHAVTMSRMDRLFGVTMGEQGVSQLVSVDLAGAERIVETAG